MFSFPYKIFLIVLINPNYDSIFKGCYLPDDKLDMDQ